MLHCGTAGALASDTFPVQEVAPGIFVHIGDMALETPANSGGIANLAFIVGAKSVAVVDTGGSVLEGRRLLAAIRAQTPLPIRYVINTHMHPDHLFGNAAFDLPGAQFVGHHNLPRALSARGDFYLKNFRRLLGDAVMTDVRIIPPTVLVPAQLTLDLGDRPIVLKAWAPAHTDNDLTVYDEKTRTLLTGDLVFVEHVPVLDGSISGFLKAIDAMALIPAQTVVPGHGPVQKDWPRALTAEKSYFTDLAKDVRGMIRAGTPISKASDAGREEAAHWKLFDDYNARNATNAYGELEWE